MSKAVINLEHRSPSGLIGGAAAIPEAQVNHPCGPNTMPHEHTLSSGTALNVFVKLRTSSSLLLESAHRCKRELKSTRGTIPEQHTVCFHVISVFLTFVSLSSEQM